MIKFLLISLTFLFSGAITAQSWVDKTIKSPVERSNSVGFSGNGLGFIMLGVNDSGNSLKDVWKYDPSTKRWARVVDFPGDARKNAIAFSIGNFGYVGAGTTGISQRRDMYEYDIINDSWTSLNNYPGNGMRLAFNAACNGKAYVGGGLTVIGGINTFFKDFYEYDPSVDVWRPLTDLPFGNRSSGVSFSINDTVYFGLGLTGSQDRNDLWAYSVNDSTWTQKSNFPGVGRVRANASVHNGKAIVGGGFRAGSANNMLGDYYEYDPATDNWTLLPANFKDSARSASATFSLNNTAYFFGGFTDNGLKNDLWGYGNVGAVNTWFRGALSSPAPRANVIAFSHGGFGYITTGNEIGGRALKDFWKYDPLNNYWIPMPDFPGDPRRNAMSFVIGNNAYVGVGTTGQSQRRDMYRFNLVNNLWDTLNNYPGLAMRLPYHAACNGKAYVGGGVTVIGGINTIFQDFYEYNPSNDSWRQLTNLPFGNRSSGISFTVGDTIYFGLGYDGSLAFNDLWGYSVKDSTWTQKASFPGIGRVRAGAVAAANGLAIVGGGFTLNGNYLSDYYTYDAAADQWISISNSFKDSARATFAMFSINNSVYTFGGATTNGTRYLNDLWEYNFSLTNLELLSQTEDRGLILFPNPSEGLFYSNVSERSLLRVFSLDGKLQYEETLRPKAVIDLRELNPSAYLFSITGPNSSESGKIVISK